MDILKLFYKIICFLIGHKSVHNDKWFPSINAPIVTRWEHTDLCLRCGNKNITVWNYDDE